MPRDVFRFVKTLGSDSYEMSNLRADINGYVQASLGFAFPIGDYVMVGVKAKGLLGVAHANANIDNLTLDISEDKVTASARGYVEAGVAGADISELKQAGDNFTIKLTDDDGSGSDFSDLTSKVRFDKNTLFKNLNNGGFALDFGRFQGALPCPVGRILDHSRQSVTHAPHHQPKRRAARQRAPNGGVTEVAKLQKRLGILLGKAALGDQHADEASEHLLIIHGHESAHRQTQKDSRDDQTERTERARPEIQVFILGQGPEIELIDGIPYPRQRRGRCRILCGQGV
jgi:hypothetical protein